MPPRCVWLKTARCGAPMPKTAVKAQKTTKQRSIVACKAKSLRSCQSTAVKEPYTCLCCWKKNRARAVCKPWNSAPDTQNPHPWAPMLNNPLNPPNPLNPLNPPNPLHPLNPPNLLNPLNPLNPPNPLNPNSPKAREEPELKEQMRENVFKALAEALGLGMRV